MTGQVREPQGAGLDRGYGADTREGWLPVCWSGLGEYCPAFAANGLLALAGDGYRDVSTVAGRRLALHTRSPRPGVDDARRDEIQAVNRPLPLKPSHLAVLACAGSFL
jgi:hypothetical protein